MPRNRYRSEPKLAFPPVPTTAGVAYLPCDIALELDTSCAAIRVEYAAQGGANWPVYVDDKLQCIR